MSFRKLHLVSGWLGTQGRSRSLYYGWWIVLSCMLLLLLVAGIGIYSLAIFFPALEAAFDASPTQAALGMTVFFLVFSMASAGVGRQVDRLGARRVMLGGILIFGLGLLGLAAAQQLWHTYLAYALVAVGFSACSLVSVSALIATWFRERRGLAMGLAMNGMSLGGVLLVPLVSRLIQGYGWRSAAIVLALLLWCVALPLVALVIRDRPAQPGGLPGGAGQPQPTPQIAGQGWSLASARRTLAFWSITGGYFLAYLAQTGTLTHQIRFLTYGAPGEGALSPAAAAGAASLGALASLLGRVALSSMVDRLNRRRVATGVVAAQGLAIAGLLLGRGSPVLIYLPVFAFGLTMGCVLMLHALLVADRFGTAAYGAVYGATLAIATLGNAAGPWVAGLLFERTGSYQLAFCLFAALSLLAAGLLATGTGRTAVRRR